MDMDEQFSLETAVSIYIAHVECDLPIGAKEDQLEAWEAKREKNFQEMKSAVIRAMANKL